MAWWFGALAHSLERQLRRARGPEKEQERRLLDAYARGLKKRREKKERDREREHRLLGSRDPGEARESESREERDPG